MQIASEADLQKALSAQSSYHRQTVLWQRIESATGSGIPDIWWSQKSGSDHGWLELKWVAGTRFDKSWKAQMAHFTAQQSDWLVSHSRSMTCALVVHDASCDTLFVTPADRGVFDVEVGELMAQGAIITLPNWQKTHALFKVLGCYN